MFTVQKLMLTLGRAAYRQSPQRAAALRPIMTAAINASSAPAAIKSEAVPVPAENSPQRPSKNPMVAAAFESLLSTDETTASKSDDIDERIINAKSVAELLSVSETSTTAITRKHALKIVSILAEWSSINRAQLTDFESDPRFIKLCRLLGRAVASNAGGGKNASGSAASAAIRAGKLGASSASSFRTDDLNTVIGVAGDDEAAKLIASISVPQMIKVMATLAQKKRRSTPLLRSLAYNIGSNATPLDLKQCADLLYAMAVLNFPDAVLIARISMDVQNGLQHNQDKPAAVGSIITSLGLLRYRDADLLESLTEWVLLHADICRPQDIASLFQTLATLNYPTLKAEAIRQQLVGGVHESDFKRSLDWLNNVWSLTVLNLASAEHIESVLKTEFVEKLAAERSAGDLSATIKLKLLNIDSATALQTPAYAGERLSVASVFEAPLAHGKNKLGLVAGMLDALKSLLASESKVRTNVNTKMGFVIDAECVLDAKNNPLPVDGEHKDAVRLAIMVLDFHDMVQGVHQQPNGVTALAFRLLEQRGYRVLSVPYSEFNTSDKLLKRVQYLEGKLKRIVSDKE